MAEVHKKLYNSLSAVLAICDTETQAEEFMIDNNLPQNCIWEDTEDGKLKLTVLGYLNGVVSEDWSDDKLVATVNEDTREIEKVELDYYQGENVESYDVDTVWM